MENRICIDTDILVDFLRNKEPAVEWIKKHDGSCLLATTIINIFELYFGAYKSAASKSNIQAVEELGKRLLILNLTPEIVKQGAEQGILLEREGQNLDFRDLLIGSIAMNGSYSLKTKNIKHFSKISRLALAKD